MDQIPPPHGENNQTLSAPDGEKDQGRQDHRVTLREAVVRLLPKDHYGMVMTIGMVAGIGCYIHSHDLQLLTTFITIMFGAVVERARSGGGSVG